MTDVDAALQQLESETDPSLRAMLLSGLISELFREQGFEPIIVGGSAIEFYTDGAYVSGDVDICFSGTQPKLPERDQVLSRMPVEKTSPRSWKILGHFFDLLGEIETLSLEEYRVLETPAGRRFTSRKSLYRQGRAHSEPRG